MIKKADSENRPGIPELLGERDIRLGRGWIAVRMVVNQDNRRRPGKDSRPIDLSWVGNEGTKSAPADDPTADDAMLISQKDNAKDFLSFPGMALRYEVDIVWTADLLGEQL